MRSLYLFLVVALMSLSSTAFAQPSYDMGDQTVTDTAGFIYDAGGASFNYYDDDTVTFTINVGAGKTVKLQFLEFDVETNEAGVAAACIYDYLEIFDGPATTLGGTRYCGNTLPPNFEVTDGMITLRFTSDGAGNQKGFKAYWTTGTLLPDPDPIYCDASGPPCGTASSAHIWSVDVDGLTYTNNTCNDDPVTFLAYSSYVDSVFQMTALTPSTITVVNDGGLGYEQVDVYIDWNNDGTFNTPEEYYPLVLSNLNEASASIVPSLTAGTGYKRMRVRVWDQAFELGVVGACGSSEYGEVEDYTIYFTNPLDSLPGCADGFSPANNAQNVCINTVLRWNPSDNATGYKVSLIELPSTKLVDNDLIADTSYDVSALLKPGKSYKYFILPTSDNGDAIGCDSVSFSTSPNADPVAAITPSASPVEACLNMPFALNGNPVNGTTPFKHAWTGTGKPFLSKDTIVNPNFTGTTLGSYQLVYKVTDKNNCSATDTIDITVISEANAGTISNPGPSTVCVNTKLQLKVVGSSGTVTIQDSIPGGSWVNCPTTKINDTIYEVVPTAVGTKSYRSTAAGTNCSATGTNFVTVTVNPAPATPIVQLIGNDTICQGQSVKLVVTNYATNITWNDAASTQNDTLTVSTSGSYVVTYTGAACPASSVAQKISVGAIPLAPISNIGSLTACADNPPLLYTAIQSGETVLWNTGETTKDISATASGDYYVTVTNAFGCSKNSDTVKVTINALPAQPQITQNGSSNPCEGEPVVLTSSYTFGNKWSNGATTQSITVYNTGAFAVSHTNVNGCKANSDTITLLFRPAPVKPKVVVTGKRNTCIGDSVTLSVNTPGTSDWNDENLTINNSVTIYKTGAYFAHYENSDGCQVYSDTVQLNFTQFQPTPTVRLSGTLCEGNTVILISSLPNGNTWDDADMTQNDSLFVTTDGTYTVTNIQNGVCKAVSAPYAVTFELRPAQPSIYEVGDSLFSSVIGSSYQWISDKGLVPNSNHYAIKPPYSSAFRVIVYSDKGCASPGSDKYVKNYVGIEEMASEGISIFPNPFTSVFTIDISNNGDHSYAIFNALGQQVVNNQLNKGNNTISPELAKGVYTLVVSGPNGQYSNKLVSE